MEEIWKDVSGYCGRYQISNLGNVKSFVKSSRHHGQVCHLLKPTLSNNGYYQVTLYKDKNVKNKFLVHKLVAQAFIQNPNNFPCVNHIDENTLNNCADNLEWCTYSYNNAYGTATIRSAITNGKNIKQFTLDGIHIATYNSIGIASQINQIPVANIRTCCEGKSYTSGGFIWKYE